jgi:hypothetical protein
MGYAVLQSQETGGGESLGFPGFELSLLSLVRFFEGYKIRLSGFYYVLVMLVCRIV